MDLIEILDAALPVTGVGADVLAQEVKDLPLIEEFVLRLVDVGVTNVDEMADLLGLDADHVDDAVSAQMSAGSLAYHPATRILSLTPRGIATVIDLKATQPVEETLPLTFDRLVWQAADYPTPLLIDKRDVEDAGLIKLPAQRTASISSEDIPVERINRLLKVRADERRIEVLGVRRVQARRPKYLPIKLLVYVDATRTDVQIATCIEGDLSPEHDLTLARLGGADRLGITISQEREEPSVDPILEELLRTHFETTHATAPPPVALQEASPSPGPVIASGEAEEEAQESLAEVAQVAVFEHPDYLTEALRSSRSRLLILSPWIRKAVVNTSFLAMLESRLRAHVDVTIAYGYSGPNSQGDDEQAVQRLSNLRDRYREKFDFVILRSTHAKVLIWDKTMITTSFNWLSFKGSRDREYRVEEGTLVRIPGVVDDAYLRYLALIREQALHG
jgi:hypothetical protein